MPGWVFLLVNALVVNYNASELIKAHVLWQLLGEAVGSILHALRKVGKTLAKIL